MQLEAQLVHAEPGRIVVRVQAMRNGQSLGSALGEATKAEDAEDRAIQRLLARFEVQPQPIEPAVLEEQAELPLASEARVASPTSPKADAPKPAAPISAAPKPASLSEAEPSLPRFAQPLGPSEDPASDPEDWSSELANLDLQLQRLGWARDQEAIYLERAFGHPSRNRLTTYVDLVAYLKALEALDPGATPANAAVPLRRKDLLSQCDQLLGQLQWDAAGGRDFLEKHFNLSSRQLLNDTELLQFNMLLEGELIGT